MEKLTENMIHFAESKLGSAEYAGWCLAFVEDALEISNHIVRKGILRAVQGRVAGRSAGTRSVCIL